MDGKGDLAGPGGVEPAEGQIVELAYQQWTSEGRLSRRAEKNWILEEALLGAQYASKCQAKPPSAGPVLAAPGRRGGGVKR